MAMTIYYGSILVREGELTVGDISAFLLYVSNLILNFVILGIVAGNVFKVAGASEKIVQMMKTPTLIGTGGQKIIEES